MSLAPSYDPGTFESRIYAEWEAAGVFAPRGDGPAYTILLPPPNVTGTLHMGHAFQHTLQDALIRYHRMRGYRTLWQMGSDHAGIATEMVVSRNLAIAGSGETRDSLGREGFIAKVWEWKRQSGDTIERQMRRLGTSGDWSRKVFTMDEGPSKAVIEAFVRLHEQGLIYRGKRLVNWDPVLQTAVSDLEVVSEEEDGFLWSIRYPLADGRSYEHVERDADGNEVLRETRDYLVVATTRPETMLGDTAVMVHPEDARYADLHGASVELPLTGRRIPLITDDYVDRAFGTGVVKVTPAHDFNDYAVWQRHVETGAFDSLPNRGLISIFTKAARVKSSHLDDFSFAPVDGVQLADEPIVGQSISEQIPSSYRGLDRFEARKSVLKDLASIGQLVEAKPHKLQVPRGDRSGQVIEPYLTDQWFVAMDQMGRRGMELVESGSVKFVPPNWINTYRHWMENIQDWTISRQLWWGHQIPAWYDMWGKPTVARSRDDAYEIFLSGAHEDPDMEGSSEARIEQVRRIVLTSKRSDTELADELESAGLHRYALKRDSDVLETWFSAALWPFSTLGWPDETAMRERGFEDFLPTSVLVTGFDIIFFWVARMVMMTDALTGKVAFDDVYITGLVRDKDGQKMSKSKGNILDPIDIIDGISADALVAKRTTGLMKPGDAPKIEKATRKEFPDGIPGHGADPLRFTMAALAGPGRDIKFDLGRADGYRNFCNKLWNATRFVLMNTEALKPSPSRGGLGGDGVDGVAPVTDAEKWILSRLAATAAEAEAHFASYRFDLLAQALYEFAWNEFCDWFVELAKPALNGDDPAAADSTRHTLLTVLESLLRLLHPLIPFVTEELWRQVAPRLGLEGDTVSLQRYPQAADFAGDYARAEADVEWLRQMVTALRRIRSELGVSPNRQVPLLVQAGSSDDRARLARFDSQLRFLNRLSSVDAIDGDPPPAAAGLVGGLKLFVPLEGLVDLDAERTRLEREIARVASEQAKSEAKLAKFSDKVPPAVVEQERQRLADWTAQHAALAAQRARLA